MTSRSPRPTTTDIVSAVREIYRELEHRPIERNCTRLTECCQFRITGRTPFLTKAEALVAAKAWRAAGRTKLPVSPDGACPMLNRHTGKCAIYESRPFGCRTHFCPAAGGPYARRDVSDLIYKLEDLSRGLGGREAQPLASAVETALKEL